MITTKEMPTADCAIAPFAICKKKRNLDETSSMPILKRLEFTPTTIIEDFAAVSFGQNRQKRNNMEIDQQDSDAELAQIGKRLHLHNEDSDYYADSESEQFVLNNSEVQIPNMFNATYSTALSSTDSSYLEINALLHSLHFVRSMRHDNKSRHNSELTSHTGTHVIHLHE